MSLQLLFECLSEEIPARMHDASVKQMQDLVNSKFNKYKIDFDNVKVFVTSRRLVLFVDNIKTKSGDADEIKGPRVNSPSKAIEGFSRKTGKSINNLVIRKIDNEDFYFAVYNNEEVNISKVIKNALEEILHNFSWPKSMRWGSGKAHWVRPIINMMCLLGGEIIPIEFADLVANNCTFGNKLLSKGHSFEISNFSSYVNKMKENYVILSQEERLNFILEQIHSLTDPHGLIYETDINLLNELKGILEYPLVIMGQVNQKFCDLPKELVLSVMHNQQRYIAVFNEDSEITNFIAVTNIINENVIEGHEKVLNARLTDAKFLITQDLKNNLDYYAEKLEKLLFHSKLGSVKDKVHRIVALAKYISIWIPHAPLIQVERAAQLAKADLATTAVKEFPELQGVIGSYYASCFGEEREVCQTILNHYSPINSKQGCPNSPITIAVAIADKIDSLSGLISAGEKVTASRDPFALRRTAIGLIRIIIENKLHIPLRLLVEKSLSLYPKSLFGEGVINMIKHVAIKDRDYHDNNRRALSLYIVSFLYDRFIVILKDQGIRLDIINSVVFEKKQSDDLFFLKQKVTILNQYLNQEKGLAILSVYKRVSNITEKLFGQVNKVLRNLCSKKLLVEKEEIELLEKRSVYYATIKQLMKDNNLIEALDKLFEFCDYINQFMDNVHINISDQALKKNRLILIMNVKSVFTLITNFDKIKNI